MTCKIKRRSLRCGGRPKADFGSIFTTFIAPALGVAGSVADSAISKTQVSKSNTKPAVKETNTEVTNNNTSVENLPTIQVPTKEPISGLITSNTIIPSDPTKTPTMKLGGRKKCWIGAAIGAATSIAGSLFGNGAKKREMRRQKSIQDWQNTTQEAANMTTALNNSQDYQEDYLRQFRTAARLGKTLGAKGIYITDGGGATKIGNNTYLLRGGSHEDVNETGQTGIGINVGGNEVEAEGGEVAQKKNGALRIFSAQPILGNGMSPAQAILRGYNKNKVFNAQQAFKRRNGLKDDGSKAQIGGYYGANYPSPLSLLSVIYDKTLGRFDNKNPFLQTGTAPTPSRGLNLKQVRSGLVNRNMLRTNRVYRIANMREVKDAKAIGQYRKLPEGVTLPTKTVRTRSGRSFEFGKAGGNSHGGKAAAMGEPWTGTTSGGYNESKYVISTPSRHTVWQVGHHGSYSKPLPADAIKKGSGLWKKFDDEGNTGISTKRMVVYKDLGNGRYLRLPKSKYRLGGGLTSKDRGSSKHPYPSVSSKDFAGGGRSYPIPTKADAVDALRLAGLHGRSDVRTKVYSRYPELRKKARGGAEIEPYYDWARNTSSNLGISFIDPDYDYRAYYNSVTPYERTLIRFAPKETHFTDIGKTPKHATFSNESKYSNDKTTGGTWNGNVFVPNIWQFGNNGNSRRNKYMNNSGEGYFNGRVNVFPTSRKRHSLGGCSLPVKGMRPKADTGIFVPYNKRYTSIYDAPDYNSDYNGGNVLGNGEVTVTAKRIKPTFMKPNNDAMNIINHPANETPYIPQRHNRSRTIFSGGDYLGLGIDTLAALSTGLVNYNTAGKYTLPDRAPIIQASKLPTTYNVNPEIEEVKRYRDRLTRQTFNNTSSSVAALNRSGAINLDALSNLSKLWATKENEENKMITEDAKNQQTVAAQNVQNELARQSEIARIKNEATQAKGDALNVGLSGLSQAWTNFWTAGRTAYEDDQARRAMIASSKDATPTRLMEMDFDLSPDVIAALYRSANEDRTKRFYLSRLSPKQRQKYGIN